MNNNMTALEMDDDIEHLVEQVYANASMACGNGEFEKNAHHQFCVNMSRLEEILRRSGFLPRHENDKKNED